MPDLALDFTTAIEGGFLPGVSRTTRNPFEAVEAACAYKRRDPEALVTIIVDVADPSEPVRFTQQERQILVAALNFHADREGFEEGSGIPLEPGTLTALADRIAKAGA